MSYLAAINKVRHEILKDNEKPRDLLISESLKYLVLNEVNPLRVYRSGEEYSHLMGMRIEWTKPKRLTQPQMSIRTETGDVRIVSYE